jgi:hypothetical protein
MEWHSLFGFQVYVSNVEAKDDLKEEPKKADDNNMENTKPILGCRRANFLNINLQSQGLSKIDQETPALSKGIWLGVKYC